MEPALLEDKSIDDVIEIPGYKNYLIFTDESGTHGATHYGFGSLWLPTQRRGDLQRLVNDLRTRHALSSDEIKWNKINKKNQAFYQELVGLFFSYKWLMFHALVVRKGYVDKTLHQGDFDLARRKHFTMLIRKKVALFTKGATDKAYHIRVDPPPLKIQES